jgi:hypothetical protein
LVHNLKQYLTKENLENNYFILGEI